MKNQFEKYHAQRNVACTTQKYTLIINKMEVYSTDIIVTIKLKTYFTIFIEVKISKYFCTNFAWEILFVT